MEAALDRERAACAPDSRRPRWQDPRSDCASSTCACKVFKRADSAKAQREAAEEQVSSAAAQMDVTRVQITGAIATTASTQATTAPRMSAVLRLSGLRFGLFSGAASPSADFLSSSAMRIQRI
jgi:hypothetical protein